MSIDFTFGSGFFPEYGVRCKDCHDLVDLIHVRKSGRCNDCEFDFLTPPAWLHVFQKSMERWQRNTGAS